MNRLFLRWIALFLFAVAGASSRAPEEAEVAIPDKGKKAKATAVKTFDAPRAPRPAIRLSALSMKRRSKQTR
jgi:hypothetical protein